MIRKARAIAFYLPQYHPVEANDQFWGKGFTEWTNVIKAKPLFWGHQQPTLPSDLGFYDLRVPEVRKEQAALAKKAGIEAFCYWHYWFGEGERVLERIFDEVLANGEPDFPFCLGWANESWTGKWHGLDNQIIFEQKYLGEEDCIEHFNTVLPAFKDKRYFRVNDRPLFLIYNLVDFPHPEEFTALWQRLAIKAGLKGIHFVGVHYERENPKSGFEHLISSNPWAGKYYLAVKNGILHKLFSLIGIEIPQIVDYKLYTKIMKAEKLSDYEIPVVIPNWDNTPRSKYRGMLFNNATPALYEDWLKYEIEKIQHRPFEERIVFIKSWNEWAEGNFLEPSQRFGHEYLLATQRAILG